MYLTTSNEGYYCLFTSLNVTVQLSQRVLIMQFVGEKYRICKNLNGTEAVFPFSCTFFTVIFWKGKSTFHKQYSDFSVVFFYTNTIIHSLRLWKIITRHFDFRYQLYVHILICFQSSWNIICQVPVRNVL